MDDYAGRVLADRYRLPMPPSDEYELAESRAFDTYSGQEVLVRQVPLPEIVEAEVVDEDDLHDLPDGFVARAGGAGLRRASARTTRRTTDPAVRRAIEAAQAAAQIPDHPRLDQVFDVFAEGGSLWIVSELVAARPLAALLADRPLSPYRAAEVAADVLAALRVLHAHGWVHRNITARTVLICDDGRVMLTGLAAGAAEEALCGHDPRPVEAGQPAGSAGSVGNVAAYEGASYGDTSGYEAFGYEAEDVPLDPAPEPDGNGNGNGARAAGRTDAVAAYRAGARAAARANEEGGLPAPPAGYAPARGARDVRDDHEEPGAPGRISDPYGVAGTKPWHGAVPRGGGPTARNAGASGSGTGAGGRSALPGGVTGRDDRGRGALPTRGSRDDSGSAGPASRGSGTAPHGSRGDLGTEGSASRGAGAVARGGWGEPGVEGPGSHGSGTAPRGSCDDSGSAGPAPRGSWDDPGVEGTALRGPATALAAERARHARMVVVGAVTERWAPEQAGTVHANWRLAAPIGPATDLWALGALLFRAVQGHAPYPEDSTAELVQMVCAEPPAFAEECGPLRPVVESLLRQDPTDRLDFEELSGWLRSLVRSAPEPEAGANVVPVPPYDAGRLPIVRRRGEVVRKRRGASAPAPAPAPTGNGHGRHKRGKTRGAKGREPRVTSSLASAPTARPLREPVPSREPRPPRERVEHGERRERVPQARGGARPRSLGRLLLLVILIGLVAAITYAMVFMPKSDEGASGDRAGNAGEASSAPGTSGGTGDGKGDDKGDGKGDGKGSTRPSHGEEKPDNKPSSQEPQSNGPELPQGFALRKDAEGFRVAVASGWDRQPKNGRGQVLYTHGDFELLVVPGRDSTDSYGSDPMKYQREDERELQPFRDSSWATSSGMRRIDVGGRAMAEGQFTWQDSGGREIFVRNLAMVVGGKYHVVQVRGPEAERDEVDRLYEQASATYQVVG
ncbi:protein kinase [Streptomyces sp. NPDC041068]|uniref:protein kinase n=1 Tax=Streptomyces sp. NPDC041068 TaxID=3155130 RepID=UPI0033CCEC48